MLTPILEKYAKVIIDYALDVQPMEEIRLVASTATEPFFKALYTRILQRNGIPRPMLAFDHDEYEALFYSHCNDDMLNYVSPISRYEMEHLHGQVFVHAPRNLKAHAQTNVQKRSIRMQAHQPLSQLMMKRQTEGTFKWVYCCFPTHALAQEANMGIDAYQNFVYNACHLFEDDPVQAWLDLSQLQQKYVDYFNTKKQLRIVGEDTDLTLSVDGRNWINSNGKLNIPDGEIYTSPIEESAQGTILFDYPAIFQGNEVDQIRLTFEKGEVIKAEAKQGEAFLNQMLQADPNAKRLGEVAIGTNSHIQQHTRNILFDEKIGGSCHLAVGFSLPGTGGKNTSAIHWDMIKNMKQGGNIYLDDELIYENGVFLI